MTDGIAVDDCTWRDCSIKSGNGHEGWEIGRWPGRELKFGNKNDNIAGLQLADLIAYPCYQRVKARQFGQECGASFGEQIADIIEGSKFRRSAMGTIKGYGTKWLP